MPQRPRLARIAAGVLLLAIPLAGGAAAELQQLVRAAAPAVPAPAAENREPQFPGGRGALSNILPADYVGPDACKRCHAENHRSWLDHPHRRMNQLASDQSVLADFGGRELRIGDGVARFDRHGPGHFTVALQRPDSPRRVYRVTRTIGSRLKQLYVGVLVEGLPVRRSARSDEVVLPFGWWIEQRRWMPINYFEAFGDDLDAHGQPVLDPWRPSDTQKTAADLPIRKVCVNCHNTTPYLYRLADPWPPLRGFSERDLLADAPALRGELAKSVDLADNPGWPPRFPERMPLPELVTVGISCESCHFGARAHAEDSEDYLFGPSSPHLRLRPASPAQRGERAKDNPFIVNGLCRQCHSSDVGNYPDGSALTSSAEALELERGACASQIACTSCHDPHVAGPKAEGGPDDPKHLAACTGCHGEFAEQSAARAHARHGPEQASCLDCHMPRITQGITRAVRSHRISIPVDARMIAAGAPNACNGCHGDRSPAWTLAELERLWGRRVPPDPSWAATWGGSLDTPALDAWTTSASQHTQLVAADLLAQRDDARSMEQLLSLLGDPAGMTRAFAAIAIERRLGRRFAEDELDVTAPEPMRARQVAALRATLLASAAASNAAR